MSKVNELGTAKLTYEDKSIDLPVFVGSEQEAAVDIRALRKETGMITYDPGFVNTGCCLSDITFIDGEKGILRYRGYDINDLAEKCEFIDVAYLLVHGVLPNKEQHDEFSQHLNTHSLMHEDMRHFFDAYPDHAHPMATLSAMAVSLSTFYPELDDVSLQENIDFKVTRLLSKMRTAAAFAYKKSIGHPIVYPSHDLKYCENFLNMMFHTPVNNYQVDPVVTKALNKLLILHADHEQNCSASVVKMVGSAGANLYASISAGICALWGPLHGGANQHVIEMLERIIVEDKGDVKRVIERAKDKNDPFRLMGVGHRVYKSYDPRAKVAKQMCKDVLAQMGVSDPLVDLAQEVEEAVLADDYFVSRGLYPNIDFYTGLTYRAMGIPTNMFTVMFAIGRIPGWIAQWLEMRDDPHGRIGRPRQIYTGPTQRSMS
ncbi:MAG: citrate synthase [Kiritimatiellales bacterium]|nr:citrate synthase [Pontiella sp.]NNJ69701.1 citrate synthase [Kiritimatiellales bacterium]